MEKNALVNLLQRLGLQKVAIRNNNITACCPNHNERRPSWGMSLDYPHFQSCFACGYSGTLRSMLVYLFKWGHEKAAQVIGQKDVKADDLYFLDKPYGGEEDSDVSVSDLEDTHEDHLLAFRLEPVATNYLLRRGISIDTMVALELSYHRSDHRVIFPWYMGREFKGATGRTVTGNPAKIVAYLGLKKGTSLYVPSRVLEPDKPLVLVEGEIDAIKVWQSGFKNVAALSFARFTEQQRRIVLQLQPTEVLTYFDNDQAGRRITRTVYEALSVELPVYEVPYLGSSMLELGPEDKQDPGMAPDWLNRLRLSRRVKIAPWRAFDA